MKNKLSACTLGGILFVSLAGTLSHFLYEWLGQNLIVGLFTPVNESIWEHIKLLFFPALLYALFLRLSGKEELKDAAGALEAGNLAGCVLIPVLYYTYSGILGFTLTAVDIAIFYISVLAAFLLFHRLMLRGLPSHPRIFHITSALLAVLFWIFTLSPPQLPLFVPPLP